MALDALYAGSVTLVVLAVLEGFEPGFVSRFFNLAWLAAWVLGTSFLSFVTHHGETAGVEGKGAGLAMGLAVVGAWVVWRLVPSEVAPVWRIAAALATLIVGLLLPVFTKR